MPMQTYRLELSETADSGGDDSDAGIDADLYGPDDLIEASTRISYGDYGIEPASSRADPSSIVEDVTADVTSLDLQVQRDDAGFSFRVLGDRDELLTQRVDDENWGLE